MKKLSVFFIIIAALMMVVPAAAMPFFSGAANTEKRELSRLPAVIREDGSLNQNFSVEMNTYFQEHIGFRNALISANSLIRTGLFGQGTSDDVIVGKDGWLFYGESVKDYLNAATITPRNAASAAHTLAMLEEYAESGGSRFLFVIVPNKNTIYGDMMPSYYRPRRESGNRELIAEALRAEKVSFIDLTDAFDGLSKPVYQKQDSHWTYEGALIGYRAMMQASGFAYNAFDGLTFREEKNWPGDLSIYLYGEAAQADIQAYPNMDFTYSYLSRNTNVDSLTLETENLAGEGSLVIYRDSFCNTMQAYLAQSFERALFSRALPYQAELIRGKKADVAILEIAERMLSDFVYRAPRMPAPAVEKNWNAHSLAEGLATCKKEESGDYIHLYGSIEPSILKDSYRVYLLAEKEGKLLGFEAFPIYEKELLGEAARMDNGWSLYLGNTQITGSEKMSLLVESGDMAYLVPLAGEK